MVAVSTIASGESNWRRCSLIGSFWGLGHATSLLVMATAKTATAGFLYMAALAFGLIGMGLLSALLTLPLSALRSRYETLHLRFQFISGVCSVAFGLWLFSEPLAEFL